MIQCDVNVLSINKEDKMYMCDNGNEYPLFEGTEDIPLQELQRHINIAKGCVINILKQIKKV